MGSDSIDLTLNWHFYQILQNQSSLTPLIRTILPEERPKVSQLRETMAHEEIDVYVSHYMHSFDN
jgi:hypothetical protein